ncbi:GTPase [Aeoliella sp.]|uniref:GTPase n=1 Tax=Aeoliella sp. TaxID=2795800 RepID=UPI003CCBCD02
MSTKTDNSPTVSVLTPSGRGAIAVVSVDGPGAANAVEPLFLSASGQPLGELPVGRIAFGRWNAANGEEVVVTRFDDRVEVHCHGGVAASRAIVESLEQRGCQPIGRAEWLEANTPYPIAAAAHELLGRVQTEKAALILLDQLNGALRAEIERIVKLLDTEQWSEAQQVLQTLLERQPLGERLTQPARVVLTGPPNVGKSSLINALVGYERAIVFDLPGTTRDLVTATTAIDGWAVELVDTAGLRAEATGIEQTGIELAQQAIAAADLVLRVGDARTCLSGAAPETVFDKWVDGKSIVEVANKADLLLAEERSELLERASDSFALTSATAVEGIDTLLARIAEVVVPQELPPGAAVPVTKEQFESLEAAHQHAASGEVASAKQTLLAMLG